MRLFRVPSFPAVAAPVDIPLVRHSDAAPVDIPLVRHSDAAERTEQAATHSNCSLAVKEPVCLAIVKQERLHFYSRLQQ